MTAHVNARGRNASDFSGWAELRIIPWWAYALALAVFAGVQLLFHRIAWPGETHPPPTAFQVLFPLFIGMIPAFLALLVGYVNADAGRRGMSRALWTIAVIFVPSAMGFILYFLLRAPIQGGCPGCGAAVDARANYCARCGYNFHPTCPECKAAIGPGDRFCSRCGAGLADAA